LILLADDFGTAAAWAADEAVRRVGMGALPAVGVEAFIQDAIKSWLDKYGPELGAQLTSIAEPAAKKAAEVVRPQVEAALKAYIPQFAAISGGLMGMAVLLGVWIAKTSRGENL
jgi:hypothetical protein